MKKHAYQAGLHTREEVRTITCPVCRVNPGERCVSHAGVERESNHLGRLDAYKKTQHRAVG